MENKYNIKHDKLNDFVYTVSQYRKNNFYRYLYFINGITNNFYLMSKEKINYFDNTLISLIHEKKTNKIYLKHD